MIDFFKFKYDLKIYRKQAQQKNLGIILNNPVIQYR